MAAYSDVEFFNRYYLSSPHRPQRVPIAVLESGGMAYILHGPIMQVQCWPCLYNTVPALHNGFRLKRKLTSTGSALSPSQAATNRPRNLKVLIFGVRDSHFEFGLLNKPRAWLILVFFLDTELRCF